MRKRLDALRQFASRPWVAEISALAGGVVYLVLALIDAESLRSFLDEGLYLYKGWLFVSGQYVPYQDYGLWTNQMPFSYLIAGTVQYLFGPSLRVGRYFAIFLSLLTLLGLWLLARRFSNRWLAMAIVWAVALDPAVIKIYTMAISQGLIACLLTWTLVLALGENRPTWQIGLGSFLAGIMLMTRINMTPVLPLLILYVFWQHGKKAGWTAVIVGSFIVIVGHILYWPNIINYWAAWLPKNLTPFLNDHRITFTGIPAQVTEPTSLGFWQERLLYFWMAIRLHPFALISAIATLLLWPKTAAWRSSPNFKAAIFTAILLLVLWGMHFDVALGPNSFCVSCTILYVGFFDFLGLVLLALSLIHLRTKLSTVRKAITAVVLLAITTGIGYSAYEDLKQFTKAVLSIEIPRIKGGQVLSGTITLFQMLINKFHTPPDTYDPYFLIVPPIVGLLAGLLILLIAWLIARSTLRNRPKTTVIVALDILLALSLTLSPTILLGGGNDFFACQNVIAAFEEAAQKIRETIPYGERVYWEGRSAAIFLYLPELQVYPPQLNHIHNYYIGGDSDPLLRLGYWNDTLARQWLNESRYALIEKDYMQSWEQEVLYSGQFKEIETPRLGACRSATRISIFRHE
jgi:hypothetical protein